MISKKSSSKLTINRSPTRHESTIMANTSSGDRKAEEMVGALANVFKRMYDDGLTEVYIDKLRQRIQRKEDNERAIEREKQAKELKKKKDMKAMGVSNAKTSSMPTNLTFDTQGKPLSMKNVNTDKLPNITGENLDVREEPQYNELALKMQRTSQKVSAMRKSE